MPHSSPFPPSSSKPGHGTIHLSLFPPSTPTFSTLTYTYPLKLIHSTPHKVLRPQDSTNDSPQRTEADTSASPSKQPTQCPLLFLLTYGGGLLAGDSITVTLTLDSHTRLCITTQGMTKIFKPQLQSTATTTNTSSQTLTAHIGAHASLWLCPDPAQPFASSSYTQSQAFHLSSSASLGVVDWVVAGRSARGEEWAFSSYTSRNEIHVTQPPTTISNEGKKRLLLRDNLILSQPNLKQRMHNTNIIGTILLHGYLFFSLADFFVEEFAKMPRIGARDWGEREEREVTGEEKWRRQRWEMEEASGVVWTACHVRGCTVVKVMAPGYEGVREWVGAMLKWEGSIGREFGEGGLMFVR